MKYRKERRIELDNDIYFIIYRFIYNRQCEVCELVKVCYFINYAEDIEDGYDTEHYLHTILDCDDCPFIEHELSDDSCRDKIRAILLLL